ncbi:hypothetical protein [Salinibacter pepae]|uniref:hypothetical protein n=1 Tax=Salinibacter pepae TaxID=3040382 RepID=UPI0021E7C146|nr:hypothetical protein [Salinibacter pepae]
MSYYFSAFGLMYLLPIVLVYGLVWYKRPLTAVLVTVFAMKAFFEVLTGHMVSYAVGAVLGGAVALSWSAGQWKWNAGLFLLGVGLLFWVTHSNGVLYVAGSLNPPAAYGMTAGVGIAVLRAGFYGVLRLLSSKEKPHPI